MTISTGNKIALTAFLLILGIWAYVTCQIIGMFDQRSINDKQYHVDSLNIANELRQSSDDLTRMARTFVATGNETYKQYYFEIIAIRNGLSPRPNKYSSTYWYTSLTSDDEAAKTKLGKALPLQTLMREMGFTPNELMLLRQSKNRSDNLMKIEKQAFAAIQGRYDDGTGQFNINGAPDRDFAIKLLFSPQYNEAKISIMKPLQTFIEAVENRLIIESENFQNKQQQYLWYAITLLIISTLLALIAAIYVRNNIVLPILSLNHDAHIIAKGNYQLRSKVNIENEIGSLSKSLNKMAHQIEQDIDQLKRMAATDELVGISNRRAFIKSLALELERSHRYEVPLSLLMLDVDNFKLFNDTYGHCIGDNVLKTICKVSQLALRENDIMGRIGGEEFAFILPTTEIDSALIVAERIRIAVETSSIMVNDEKLKITVSIGASQLIKGDDVSIFLNRADVAMYKAKNNGRNQTYST